MTTNSESPLLRLRGVSKRFGGVQALTGIDLSVERGEVVALVGDNAAGKSTIARAIAGVYQPDGGTIEIDGVPVTFPAPRRPSRRVSPPSSRSSRSSRNWT